MDRLKFFKILIFLIYVKSQWKRISKNFKFYVVNKINKNNQQTEYLWTITPSGKNPFINYVRPDEYNFVLKQCLWLLLFPKNRNRF